MNSTDPRASERLAAELFDRVLTPLAAARRARGAAPYFPLGRDAGLATYFTRPQVCVMELADFEFPGHGAATGLIQALGAFWESSGEPDLCALIPMMRKTAAALEEEAVENDGTVSVFCYAMF